MGGGGGLLLRRLVALSRRLFFRRRDVLQERIRRLLRGVLVAVEKRLELLRVKKTVVELPLHVVHGRFAPATDVISVLLQSRLCYVLSSTRLINITYAASAALGCRSVSLILSAVEFVPHVTKELVNAQHERENTHNNCEPFQHPTDILVGRGNSQAEANSERHCQACRADGPKKIVAVVSVRLRLGLMDTTRNTFKPGSGVRSAGNEHKRRKQARQPASPGTEDKECILSERTQSAGLSQLPRKWLPLLRSTFA